MRVNAVALGLIITEKWANGRKIPGLADGLERHIALGRVVDEVLGTRHLPDQMAEHLLPPLLTLFCPKRRRQRTLVSRDEDKTASLESIAF